MSAERASTAPQAGSRRADGKLPTGRHGLSPEEVKASQKQRLMDAMAELCASKGYHATTIAELVTRAGVSRATYYEIFDDKEDCFVATMREGARHLAAGVAPALGDDNTEWDARVEAVVDRLLHFLAEDPTYSIAAMVEALAGGEESYEIYVGGTNMIMELLRLGRQYLPEGVELPDATERIVVGGGEWLIAGEMIAGRVDRIPDLIADYIYIATLPYLGQEEALDRMNEARRRLRS